MNKPATLFTPEDISQIKAEGLTVSRVETQIESMIAGAEYVKLNRPCTVSDGIAQISSREKEELVGIFDEEAEKIDIVKFLPASGAASRMFSDWFQALENNGFESAEESGKFLGSLEKYAFRSDLEKSVRLNGGDLRDLIGRRRTGDILRYILTPDGLNYGNLPKALLKFHRYSEDVLKSPEEISRTAPQAGSRTAIEEHLVEAAFYARGKSNISRIHITVSAEHEGAVAEYLEKVLPAYERRYDVKYDLDLSIQSSSTNTIALDGDNRPLRDENGKLVFRPGGHGSLLKNLNSIKGDIIIIKNIDNIVPEMMNGPSIMYKKILAGFFIRLRSRIFEYLKLINEKRISDALLQEAESFCKDHLNTGMPAGFENMNVAKKAEMLFNSMNRPLRVCGMVKNEGEPGGGPFWVEEGSGMTSMQIVEGFQIDQSSKDQMNIWHSSTHFNPVDLVCGIVDYRGQKFDLDDFVNRKAFCVSRKTEKGRVIKALELPGLWNGSMALWNTVFVEVPLETFNPVKTVYDLLRPQHLPS